MATLNYYDKDKGEWVAIPLGGGGGDSVVTAHPGSIPQPKSPTPQAFEDAFTDYEDGLHFFQGDGALIAISRAEFQSTFVMNGPIRSVVRIVKHEQGLPTTDNPSMLVNCNPDGSWLRLTSDELTKPFGNPQMADPIALDTSNLVAKPELAAAIEPGGLIDSIVAELSREPTALSNWMRVILTSPDFQTGLPEHMHAMTDIPGLYSSIEGIGWKLDDRYTKAEADAKLEALKDFSIANDNNLLAGLTALQNTVSNLNVGGTEVLGVLEAIQGASIEPEIVKLGDLGVGSIRWADSALLGAGRDQANKVCLYWNDGSTVDFVVVRNDLLPLYEDVAKKADLNNAEQIITSKALVATAFAFDTTSGIRYFDTGEGYGKRLVFAYNEGSGEKVEHLVYASDLGEIPQAPTAWADLPLQSGWTAGAAGTPQYRLNNGNLELRGEVVFTSLLNTETYTNAGRLPVGFRPAATRSLIVPTGGGSVGAIATLYVRTDGYIQFCPRLTPASGFAMNVVVPGVIQ